MVARGSPSWVTLTGSWLTSGTARCLRRRETAGFDRLRLDRLRDDFDTFSGEYFGELFESWKRSGDTLLRHELAALKAPCGRFTPYRLQHDYEMFGRVEEAS